MRKRVVPYDLIADLGLEDVTGTAWAPTINASDAASVAAEKLAPQFFAFSLLPYLVFLFLLWRNESFPRLATIGFTTLLIFVFVTIPAGIYAKIEYGTSLANVDWLHGSAEAFLSLTNVIIVAGFRGAIRDAKEDTESG